jgi:hypothetical protein
MAGSIAKLVNLSLLGRNCNCNLFRVKQKNFQENCSAMKEELPYIAVFGATA